MTSNEAGAARPARGLKRAQVHVVTVFFIICILASGAVLYYTFRAVYGGPSTPAREAGDAAIVIAEAEAEEDAS